MSGIWDCTWDTEVEEGFEWTTSPAPLEVIENTCSNK